MWTFANLHSPEFLFLFIFAILGTIYWVTYSLQEILILFRKNIKNRAKQHLKELENYREELKRRN